MKPIVRLSSLIELNKKFTSLSAIFDIYFIWKDDNLIANASSSNAVFFFNRNKERSCKIELISPQKRWIVILKMPYLKNFKKTFRAAWSSYVQLRLCNFWFSFDPFLLENDQKRSDIIYGCCLIRFGDSFCTHLIQTK
mgnify:CR=1 FL=1